MVLHQMLLMLSAHATLTTECVGHGKCFICQLKIRSDKRLDFVLSITLNAFSRTQELRIPSNNTHPCFLAFVIIAAI